MLGWFSQRPLPMSVFGYFGPFPQGRPLAFAINVVEDPRLTVPMKVQLLTQEALMTEIFYALAKLRAYKGSYAGDYAIWLLKQMFYVNNLPFVWHRSVDEIDQILRDASACFE